MSEAELINADPTVESPTPAQKDAEMLEHVGTYNGFVHLVMWFIFHIPFLLLGIYAMTLGGSIAGGVVLAVIGLAMLIYGVVTTGSQSANRA